MKSGFLAALGGAAMIMAAASTASAQDCTSDKAADDLEAADIQALYDCINGALLEGYQSGDSEVAKEYRDWKTASTRPAAPGPQGEPSVPLDPALPGAFYLACGYQPAGRRAVRVDRLDRAASMAARLSRTGPFVPPRELPSVLGCPESEVAGVLSGIGYVERDGRFEWRRRGRRDGRRRA